MKKIYLGAILCLYVTNSFSQENEIDTDRPSITETTSTVPMKNFQMENGFLHQQEDKGSYTLFIPTSLLKFGVLDNLEVRLQADIATEKQDGEKVSGFQPLTVGFKANIRKQQGLLPEISLLSETQLPKVASGEFKEEHLAPELKLLFKNKINENVELGYNLGEQWDGDTGQGTYQYTICPSFKLSDKVKTFVEVYGYMPQRQHPDHWVDAGLLFLMTSNLQIDIAGGYELSAHNHFHSYFETVGVSFRI